MRVRGGWDGVAVRTHLLAILDEHHDRIAGEVVQILVRSRLGRMVRDPGSAPQGTVGLLRALRDALEGRDTPTRAFWLETLFPSLIERGVTLVDITRVCTRICIAVSLMLVAELPPELRAPGGEWLSAFFGALQGDVTRECLRAAAIDALSISGERVSKTAP